MKEPKTLCKTKEMQTKLVRSQTVIKFYFNIAKDASRLRFIPNYWHIFIQNNTRIFCLSLHRFLTNIYTD